MNQFKLGWQVHGLLLFLEIVGSCRVMCVQADFQGNLRGV